jgi:hypothetical protein
MLAWRPQREGMESPSVRSYVRNIKTLAQRPLVDAGAWNIGLAWMWSSSFIGAASRDRGAKCSTLQLRSQAITR